MGALARGAFFFGFALLSSLLLPVSSAFAQVIEPNGVQVPGPSNPPGEELLQDFFDMLTPPEPIDAVKDASPTPGTFSPLCGFQASIVLSKSNASAGLAWYNVPASPTGPPPAFYQIIMDTNMPGATISSDVIRSDPHYAGGLIGFALTKNFGSTTETAIYYSEYMRNANCTQCTMPGYWKMMLAYPSKLAANTYYLAFEDWEGANQSTWQGNDGDFNDKVFKLTGVRCPGGGDPCDTGKLGLCARGLTECQSNAPLACKQLFTEQPEKCDGIDNDCNGMVDDGDLCPTGMVCERGVCVGNCGSGEFVCAPGKACNDDGHCVEALCQHVQCEAGKVCHAGNCVAPCDGVTCPAGQECTLGVCADPCDGVSCDQGRVCRAGVCVERCDCAGCPSGLACNMQSGKCVASGCETTTCADGTVCVAGSCVDPCQNAVCPGGAACNAGKCEEPPPTGSTGGMSTGATGTTGSLMVTNGSNGTTDGIVSVSTSAGSTGSTDGTAASGSSNTGGLRPVSSGDSSSGCSCREARTSGGSGAAAWGGSFLALVVVRARRRRRERRPPSRND